VTNTAKFSLTVSFLLLASLACQTVVPGSATPTFDNPAAGLLDSVNATATGEAANAPARATEQAAERAIAEATQSVQQTAEAFDAVAPDLDMLGYTVESGRLAYSMDDPISIPADLPNFYFYDPLTFPRNPVFRDFVLGVDVEWDSRTGVAGCGIIVRSEDDLDMGEQIHFRTLRLSGLPAWVVWQLKYNEIKGVLTGDVRINSAINQEAHSSNHYVLEVVGTTMTVYANGTKLGSATMTVNRTEGQIAFYTWQESGESECIFSNAWVFELPPYSDAEPADQEGDPSS
jgi:hypothetical protein